MPRSQADIRSQQATMTRRGTPLDANCFITVRYNIVTRTQVVHSNFCKTTVVRHIHPIIMYTTKLKINVPVVPLVETQLIKCLQAEQITFFPLMEGLNSCITCQIHDLLALLAAAVLTIFTVAGVTFSE